MFWFALLVVFGYAVYVLRPDERKRVLVLAGRHLTVLGERLRRGTGRREPDAFDEAIAARGGRPYLTGALLALNVVVFVAMALAPGPMADPGTLVRWGGSIGPVTTNGAWWRLLTATIVHTGLLHFVIDVAALTPAAVLVEKLFGRVTFAAVYITSAVLAGAIDLWANPLLAAAGGSAPIFAFYGLLVAHIVRGTVQRSPLTIPRRVLRGIAPAPVLCALYYLSWGGAVWTAALTMFVIGFAIGVALTRGVAERTPSAERVLPLAATTLLLALVIGAPLAGMVDVRAQLSELFPLEDRMTATYDAQTVRFTRGTIKADVLAATIERDIIPEIDAARRRVDALSGMPPQQQGLVAGAGDYLRLRRQSWKTRVTALRTSNMRLLRQADSTERAAIDALGKLRSSM